MHNTQSKNRLAIWAAVGISAVGLATAGIAVAWLAGFLGISSAAAGQVATAIDIGGWALAAVAFLFTGGLAGAVFATVKAMAAKKTRAVFIV